MQSDELLRLADLALCGHLSPELPREVIRILSEASGAARGELYANGDELVAVWPPGRPSSSVVVNDPLTQELQLGGDGSRWTALLGASQPVDEGLAVAARLVLRLWDMREELRKSRFDARFRLWELEAVRSIAAGIGGILDPSRIAEEVIAHIVGLLGVRSAQLFLGGTVGEARSVALFGESAFSEPLEEGVWGEGLQTDAVLAVPLIAKSGQLGLLVVADKEARAGTEPFLDSDARLVEQFAVQTAVAFENARLSRESIERARLRQELEVAATIQSHLYPRSFPEVPGYRIRGGSRPTRQVGGDSFDVIEGDSNLLAVVADVSGKGVGAGMLAAGIHSGVRLLSTGGTGLEVIAGQLNSYLLSATEDNRFATLVLVDAAADGSFRALHAGHCPSLIRRRSGSVEELPVSGLPLGILSDASYEPAEGRLEPGDLLVMYSDGITEAEDPNGEEMGIERLKAALEEVGSVSAGVACDGLLERVAAFTDGEALHDDATLLVLERL
ncbi:MAG: SpoIIE family protein phosphatase [Acidobacteria bacterium]|nr:SpoIIE family protein phosphatase [Acidobacteriota bacterium]